MRIVARQTVSRSNIPVEQVDFPFPRLISDRISAYLRRNAEPNIAETIRGVMVDVEGDSGGYDTWVTQADFTTLSDEAIRALVESCTRMRSRSE